MVIFIGILIFAAMIGFYACFGRRINENRVIGQNVLMKTAFKP